MYGLTRMKLKNKYQHNNGRNDLPRCRFKKLDFIAFQLFNKIAEEQSLADQSVH